MSSPTDPRAESSLPPRVLPVYVPPAAHRGGAGRVLLILLLLASLAANVLLVCGGYLFRGLGADADDRSLRERWIGGSASAADKVAVVRIDGTIVEGQLGFEHRQIEEAARDNAVKAVVVRIDSPGGTISASDDLHRRLTQLRDGTLPRARRSPPVRKPLVVSMGAVAASGGYYVAMPAYEPLDAAAKKIYAERTTITGSIGVYAAFPNVEELAKKYGVALEMVKAGAVKGSGSLFYRMTPQERQPWAEMVDQAYAQFLGVVESGRPQLQGKLTENLFPPRTIPVFDDRGNPVLDDAGQPKTATFTRQRADGGIFTADDALKWGLIDAIGTLDDAVAEAARQASLTSYRAVAYERPVTLMSLITGSPSTSAVDLSRWSGHAVPRLWYLAPGSELNAVIHALGRD